MRDLYDLLEREQELTQQYLHLDYVVNVCDRDSDGNQALMRGVESKLAKVNKKIVKAMKRELKERRV